MKALAILRRSAPSLLALAFPAVLRPQLTAQNPRSAGTLSQTSRGNCARGRSRALSTPSGSLTPSLGNVANRDLAPGTTCGTLTVYWCWFSKRPADYAAGPETA